MSISADASGSPRIGRQGASVVLLGSFNPAIFQPMWFSTEELLPKSEAEGADIKFVHPGATAFESGPFGLKALVDRFEVETSQPQHHSALRDLVVGTFSLLRHTPISAVGMNRHLHFPKDAGFSWESVQHSLSPSLQWPVGDGAPDMAAIEFRWERKEGVPGYRHVKIEHSNRESGGTFFRINDHFQLGDEESVSGAGDAVDLIQANLLSSFACSEQMAVGIMEITCLR